MDTYHSLAEGPLAISEQGILASRGPSRCKQLYLSPARVERNREFGDLSIGYIARWTRSLDWFVEVWVGFNMGGPRVRVVSKELGCLRARAAGEFVMGAQLRAMVAAVRVTGYSCMRLSGLCTGVCVDVSRSMVDGVARSYSCGRRRC